MEWSGNQSRLIDPKLSQRLGRGGRLPKSGREYHITAWPKYSPVGNALNRSCWLHLIYKGRSWLPRSQEWMKWGGWRIGQANYAEKMSWTILYASNGKEIYRSICRAAQKVWLTFSLHRWTLEPDFHSQNLWRDSSTRSRSKIWEALKECTTSKKWQSTGDGGNRDEKNSILLTMAMAQGKHLWLSR